MSKYVLELKGIVKSFPGVKALKGVNLQLRSGTVHAIMGENGAGKSTLMKCIIGIYTPEAGDIFLEGKKVTFKNTIASLNAGISMIHQELSPVEERSVMENVWLGRVPMKNRVVVDHKKMHNDTVALFKQLDMDIDPLERMGNLSVAKMQMVEIAKAVSRNAKVVIMDEPTSAITHRETLALFNIIDNLKASGVSIVYITHKMDEIFRISDDVSIYRDGEYISTHAIDDITVDEIIVAMVGREITDMFPKETVEIGETVLKVDNLCGIGFKDISFELHKGEILGFAGLVGSGRTEVIETIFGLRKSTGGTVSINGEAVHIKNPKDAIKHHLALLTEDRRHSGSIGVLPLTDNTVIASIKKYGMPLKKKKIEQDTKAYIDRLKVKTPDIYTKIMNLSGGNQQKILVARWLLTVPDILFIDEPTRGIDVGAKSEIHKIITNLVKQGKSIIMVSSEMPEVLGMSDRVLVMFEGKCTGILDREEATQELVMQYATDSIMTETLRLGE